MQTALDANLSAQQTRPTPMVEPTQPTQQRVLLYVIAYSTLTTTFHPSAPASLIAHARHPRFLLLMRAFHPFCAHNARTKISMSEPNCRFLDSRCIFNSAPKPPPLMRSKRGEVGERADDSDRCRVGDLGASVMLVMQSMTRTRICPERLVLWPGLWEMGVEISSDRGVCCFCRSSEI